MSNLTTNPRRRNRVITGLAAGLAALTLGAGTAALTVGVRSARADDPASASRDRSTVVVDTRTQPRTESTAPIRPSTHQQDVQALHRYGETANPTGTTNWTSMTEFMEFVIQDADGYWTSTLRAAGLPEPMVNYRILQANEVVSSACGQIRGNENNSYYCPADDSIYLMAEFARKLWDGSYIRSTGREAIGGDFAVAWLVAHEFAHSIQREVGITPARFTELQREQHADCWAGVWGRSAEGRNLLDPGDIQEGLYAAWGMGDFTKGTHGSPEMRFNAFRTGYLGGVSTACDVFLGA